MKKMVGTFAKFQDLDYFALDNDNGDANNKNKRRQNQTRMNK